VKAKAKVGHGITVPVLEHAAELGLFRALGKRVLVRAIWEEHALSSVAGMTLDDDGMSRLSIMEAVAFEVCDVGPEVPEGKLAKGDIVLNTSISGETINGNKQAKGSPYQFVHYEDLVGGINADELAALLTSRREAAAAVVDA
jgi:hypothetical protein